MPDHVPAMPSNDGQRSRVASMAVAWAEEVMRGINDHWLHRRDRDDRSDVPEVHDQGRISVLPDAYALRVVDGRLEELENARVTARIVLPRLTGPLLRVRRELAGHIAEYGRTNDHV